MERPKNFPVRNASPEVGHFSCDSMEEGDGNKNYKEDKLGRDTENLWNQKMMDLVLRWYILQETKW